MGSSSKCLNVLLGTSGTKGQKMSSDSKIAFFMIFQEWLSDLELGFLSGQFVEGVFYSKNIF